MASLDSGARLPGFGHLSPLGKQPILSLPVFLHTFKSDHRIVGSTVDPQTTHELHEFIICRLFSVVNSS